MKKNKTTDARERILASAEHLFAAKGFDGTSVKEICNDANVNISLIYYYFQDKENILLELFDLNLQCFNLLAKDISLEEHPVDVIQRIAGEIIRFRLEEQKMMMILHREILNNSIRHEKIKTHIFPLWSKLYAMLQKGSDLGIFKFQSCDQAFQFVIAVMLFPRINPVFLESLLNKGLNTHKEILESTMNFILGGLNYNKEILDK